jgi:hypothetical protein
MMMEKSMKRVSRRSAGCFAAPAVAAFSLAIGSILVSGPARADFWSKNVATIGKGADQGWPSYIALDARCVSRPRLDRFEHDGKLG